MGFIRNFSIAVAMATTSLFIQSSACGSTHTVQEGENLSHIVQHRLVGNIWGRNGNLARVQKMNPHVKNPNKILPGEIIDFGDLSLLSKEGAMKIQTKPQPKVKSISKKSSVPKKVTETNRVKRRIKKVKKKLYKTIPPTSVPTVGVISEDFGEDLSEPLKYRLISELDYRRSWIEANNLITSEKLIIQSAYSAHFSLSYQQDWTKSFSTFQKVGLTQLKFFQVSGMSSITQTSNTQFHFSVGAKVRIVPRILILKYSLFYGEKMFLHTGSDSEVVVDSLRVPWMSGQIQYTFYRSNLIAAGFSLAGSFVGPANSNFYVYLGTILTGDVFLDININEKYSHYFRLFAGFSRRNQNTSQFILDQRDHLAGFIYNMPL